MTNLPLKSVRFSEHKSSQLRFDLVVRVIISEPELAAQSELVHKGALLFDYFYAMIILLLTEGSPHKESWIMNAWLDKALSILSTWSPIYHQFTL